MALLQMIGLLFYRFQVEREVIMVLMKALHNAESAMSHINSSHSRFPSFSKLIGDCHGRLGSLYQKIGFSELVGQVKPIKFSPDDIFVPVVCDNRNDCLQMHWAFFV